MCVCAHWDVWSEIIVLCLLDLNSGGRKGFDQTVAPVSAELEFFCNGKLHEAYYYRLQWKQEKSIMRHCLFGCNSSEIELP